MNVTNQETNEIIGSFEITSNLANSMLVNYYSQKLKGWFTETEGLESFTFYMEAAFSNVNFGTSLIVKCNIVQDSDVGFENSLTYHYYADKTKDYSYVEDVQGYSVIVFILAFLIFLSDVGVILGHIFRKSLTLGQYVMKSLSASVCLAMAGYCIYMLALRGSSGKNTPNLLKFTWNSPANTDSRIANYEFQI